MAAMNSLATTSLPPPSQGALGRRPAAPLRSRFCRSCAITSHAVVALTLAAWFPAALAIERGVSPAGIAYASGGVSHEELQGLHAQRQQFTFWLTTAALRSGAHLADVRVRIVPLRGDLPVLEHAMAGPWLFAALPLGRYTVEATFSMPNRPVQVRRAVTQIHPGDHHQMVLYFDTGDEVGAENTPALPVNPYSGAPVTLEPPARSAVPRRP